MIETDYLVIGAGAMGMAFSDVLMTESDATVVIVDRHGKPGGHWNDAYPFVRLHQPSAFYGVNSRRLGNDQKDATGWNRGLYELASGAEVLSYYDQVMNQQFLPSGRVQYFPMCNYNGADNGTGHFTSLVSGEKVEVGVRTKIVDATYMNVTVPSVRPPPYDVADGVHCAPLNELPRNRQPADGYVVVGAGKTGADACLWLLANGAVPDDITWVMPRDSWYLDRSQIQPGEYFDTRIEQTAEQLVHIAESTSIADLFERLETNGFLLRIDTRVQPTMYRCSTVTLAELEQLRRISNIVRFGHVKRIECDQIILDNGTIPTTANAFHIDCTADGLERRPVKPVFANDHLTLQTVRRCQQVFSAAFIAHVEVAYDDDAIKNELCTVVPHPDTDIDWLRSTLGNALNLARWRADDTLIEWLTHARLDGFSRPGAPSDVQLQAMTKTREHAPRAIANLEKYIAGASNG